MTKKKLTPYILFAAAICLVFIRLPLTFYQQDEWMTLGRIFAFGPIHEFTGGTRLLQIFFAEGRVGTRILGVLLQRIFFINTAPMHVVSILLHIANALLLFRLTEKLSASRATAFMAALFFAFNGVSHQAVTWMGGAVATLPCTAFLLLSLIFYHDFLQHGARKLLIFSVVALLISISFKECGLILFLLLPLMYFMFGNTSLGLRGIVDFLKKNAVLLIYAAALLLFRFKELLAQGPTSGFITAGQGNFKAKVIIHAMLYPLTSLGQILVPPLDFIAVADWFTRRQYPFLIGSPVTGLVVQAPALDILSISLTAVALAFLFRAVAKEDRKLLCFALAWAAVSFVPYAVLERSYSYLESRYYYIGAAGLGIAFALAGNRLWRTKKIWARASVVLAALVYLVPHVGLIHREIENQVALARERKPIIRELQAIKPLLQSKNVVYISGSRSYTLPEVPVPFQQGVGYTLMVLYSDSGKIPRSFLDWQYLWNLQDEGYREEGGLGFGYYTNKDHLVAELKQYGLPPDNVFAFYYDGEKKQLLNTTDEVRSSLRKS